MNSTNIYICITIGFLFLNACSFSDSGEQQDSFNLLWEYEYTGEVEGLSLVQLPPELIGTDFVVISPDRILSCLNQKNGDLLWQAPLPDNAWVSNGHLLNDGLNLYTKIHRKNKIQARNVVSGKLAWEQINLSGKFFDYANDALDSQNIYLSGDDSVAYIYSKAGDYQAEVRLQHYARSILYNIGTLYISQAWRPENSDHAAGRIVAYDSETFEKRWEFETDKGGFYYASLIYDNGRIYAGTTSGPSIFVVLDATSGDIIWERKEQVAYKYIVENDTVYINNSLELVALDAITGEELWRTDFGVGDATDNIAYLDGYLYHSHGTALYILDAANGKIVHKEVAPPDGTFFVNVAADNGRVFVMSNYHLYAYEAWR